METVEPAQIEIVTEEEVDTIHPGPVMEISVGTLQRPDAKEIVTDDQMIGLYNEILGLIRQDRQEINDVLSNFVDMVINQGDASTSSKEALVNLIKAKTDTANNMTRVMDLLIRVKNHDRSIPDVVAKQVNKFNIGTPKRKLLGELAKEAAKKRRDP